jgi:DNA-binding transcriptional LysR family regulator
VSHADLNQLRTFVALYETRSATAAADELAVTQPTVSYTLGRLRRTLGDDLFRRERNEFVPTPAAVRLYPQVRDALAQIDRALEVPTDFDPAGLTDELTLSLSSIGELTFLPPILAAMQARAPKVRIHVVPHVAADAENAISRGLVDLAISARLLPSGRLWRTAFMPVEYVAVTSRDHPLPRTRSSMFAGRRFIQVSARGGHVYPNDALVEHGLDGQIGLSVEGYAPLPRVLEQSDLVALLPLHVTQVFAERYSLTMRRLPWPIQSPPMAVYTRPEERLSPTLRWLRETVLEALTQTGSDLGPTPGTHPGGIQATGE